MSRYLLALTDAGGTVPPELGVARRLRSRGHRVTVLCDASMAAAAERTGADVRTWSVAVAPFEDWRLRSPTALARGMAEAMIAGPAAGHARDTAAAVAEVSPDAVVASFVAVGAMIAAEAAGLPYAVLVPNVYSLPAPGLPPFGLGLPPARGAPGRLRDRVLSDASTRMLGRYALEPLDGVRREHGLPPLASVWGQHQRAQRQLVLTAAAFDLPGELPGTARYVGPVLDDPDWAAGEAWTPPPGEGPLVLVAMSSTFQDHVACLQRVADALAQAGVRGVVTTGPALPPGAVRGSDRVQVLAAAPHAEVLPHAAAVVTHGGHGTVMKALAAGLPLVVLPHGRDQADNARRVALRDAGVTLSRRASAARIARAIRRVLDDGRYRDAAARLGEAIRAEAATDTLEVELESLVG